MALYTRELNVTHCCSFNSLHLHGSLCDNV
jgi:hypothetical protein